MTKLSVFFIPLKIEKSGHERVINYFIVDNTKKWEEVLFIRKLLLGTGLWPDDRFKKGIWGTVLIEEKGIFTPISQYEFNQHFLPFKVRI